MPELSIIIPVYNAEKTLKKCIDSILMQKNEDFEIILVDDGSTDSSGELCDQFHREDDRIKVIHQNNKGVSAARNCGMAHAVCEWMTFIDADDTISPTYIPISLTLSTDMYVQNWCFKGGEGYAEYLAPQLITKREIPSFLNEHAHKDIFRSSWCKFVKKGIIDRNSIRFDPEARLGEDTLFFMDYLSHCNSICVLATGFYFYYRPSENWIHKYQLGLDEILLFFHSFLNRYKDLPCPLPKLAGFEYSFFSALLNEKEKRKIKWQLSQSVLRMKDIAISKKSLLYKARLFILFRLSDMLRFLGIIRK